MFVEIIRCNLTRTLYLETCASNKYRVINIEYPRSIYRLLLIYFKDNLKIKIEIKDFTI